MKKFYYLFITLFTIGALGSFTACDSDDDDNLDNGTVVNYEQLPTTSKQFITDYFNDYSVNRTVQKLTGYQVSLSQKATTQKASLLVYHGYEIEFDRNGNWTDIEGHADSALPESVLALIPRSITSYVNQNYAGRGINEVDKETYGYKVDLTGNPDVELKFDSKGVLINSGNNSNGQNITTAELPANAQAFITTHFASYTIREIERDNDSYDVEFTNNFSVDFDINGNWKEIDANGNTIPQSILALLPTNLTSYISTNYPSNRIEKIESKVSIYEIELIGDIDLVFDKDGNNWGSNNNNNGNSQNNGSRVAFANLPSVIQTYLNDHFLTSTSFLFAEIDDNEYEINLKNGTEVDFTLTGELIKVEVIAGNSVPNSVVPQSILSYVERNYPSKKIEDFEKSQYGYKVELSGYPETDLLFDKNFNFLGIDY